MQAPRSEWDMKMVPDTLTREQSDQCWQVYEFVHMWEQMLKSVVSPNCCFLWFQAREVHAWPAAPLHISLADLHLDWLTHFFKKAIFNKSADDKSNKQKMFLKQKNIRATICELEQCGMCN